MKTGNYIQKKKNIHLNWNEDLLYPVKPAIDTAFRKILDHSCEAFKAQSAQIVTQALRDLDFVLRSMCSLLLYSILS